MLVAYSSKTGKGKLWLGRFLPCLLTLSAGLTLSPRVGSGHVEPSHYKNKTMSIELWKDSGIRNGRYVAIGVCHNCKDWHSGSIDFESRTQPMFYAVGPDELHLNSDAEDAGLRRHDYWGHFNIDLQAARGDPALFPPKDLLRTNATARSDEHNDHEYTSSLHAVAMAGTFVLIFPVGIFYKKVLGSVRWHWITQAFGLIVVLVGAGLGLGISRYYNRVRIV